MAFAALELRDVAELQWVLERAVALVADRALIGVLVSYVDRVLETSARRLDGLARKRLVESGVADGAVVADDLAVGATHIRDATLTIMMNCSTSTGSE